MNLSLLKKSFDRRTFLRMTGASTGALLLPRALGKPPIEASQIDLGPPLQNERTEGPEPKPKPSLPPSDRVGFAVVGIGHIALEQVLPAFSQSHSARLVALVSGHREKALKVARQHGVSEDLVFDYASFDRLKDHPEIQAVYIALPNSMHLEYTLRAAAAGKHVLCEKPMATNSADAEKMITACDQAHVKLMIAYRSQYEPLDRAIVKAVRERKIGVLREFISVNSQQQGDPNQWRMKRALAGGGPLPDVGIYSINAARFLSGEEPIEVFGRTQQLPGDPRFTEIESMAQFWMKFPSGFTATCTTSYASHRSQYLRLNGSEGWAELNPAFAYSGLKLRFGTMESGKPSILEPTIEQKHQFATEIDHFADCIKENRKPLTSGEEGLQDMRIIEAIYESARTGRVIALPNVVVARGPDLNQS